MNNIGEHVNTAVTAEADSSSAENNELAAPQQTDTEIKESQIGRFATVGAKLDNRVEKSKENITKAKEKIRKIGFVALRLFGSGRKKVQDAGGAITGAVRTGSERTKSAALSTVSAAEHAYSSVKNTAQTIGRFAEGVSLITEDVVVSAAEKAKEAASSAKEKNASRWDLFRKNATARAELARERKEARRAQRQAKIIDGSNLNYAAA